MIKNLLKFLLTGLSVMVSAYILPGVVVESYYVSLVVAIVLGVLNISVKPVLTFLSLPVTVITLGIFTFVIDTVIVLLAAEIVPGFEIDGFWTALVFSMLLSLVASILYRLAD